MERLRSRHIIRYLQKLVDQPTLASGIHSLMGLLNKSDPERNDFNLQKLYDALAPNSNPASQRVAASNFITSLNQQARAHDLEFTLERDKSRKPPASRHFWFMGVNLVTEEISESNIKETRPYNNGVSVDQIVLVRDTPIPARLLIKIFISHSDKDNKKGLVDDLKYRLEQHLDRENIEFKLWMFRKELLRGDPAKKTMLETLKAADGVLFAVSPNFTGSDFIKNEELEIGLKKPFISFNLLETDRGMLKNHAHPNIKKLADYWLGTDIYSSQEGEGQKNRFANILAKELIQKFKNLSFLSPSNRSSHENKFDPGILEKKDIMLDAYTGLGLSDNITNTIPVMDILQDWYEDKTKVKSFELLKETIKREREQLKEKIGKGENKTADQDDTLTKWPKFIALLGDYGVGKTWTCMRLTRAIEIRIQKGKDLPQPVLLNLLTVNGQEKIKDSYTLTEIINICLRESANTASAKQIIKKSQQGKCIILFDGLDEVLVHLTPRKSRAFINTLLEAADGENAKMIIACRTHFFKTQIAQKSAFVEGGRGFVTEKDYLSLTLRHLTRRQIEQFCDKNLEGMSFSRFWEIIKSIHNLEGLSRKIYHLTLIVDQIFRLQRLYRRGRKMNAVGLYEGIIEESFERDAGKHLLRQSHKRALLPDLAAHIWRTDAPFTYIELEAWLNGYLLDNPRIAQFYDLRKDGEKLYQDLRNASLLVREDSKHFIFSHRSLMEYFLAQHLVKALAERDTVPWETMNPSMETLGFVADILDMRDNMDPGIRRGFALLFKASKTAAKNAFLLWTRLPDKLERPDRIDLSGQDLSGLTLIGASSHPWPLTHINFSHADLSGSDLRHIDFTGSDFSHCRGHDAIWQFADLRKAHTQKMIHHGPLLRKCAIRIPPKSGSPPAHPHQNKPASPLIPVMMMGHISSVSDAALAPDGKSVISASDDHSLKLWNMDGKCLKTFNGHKDSVTSCAFAPDGKTVISASYDKSLKLWNRDGKCLKTFIGHKYPVTSCAFAPDGKTVISASDDHSLKLWNRDGKCLKTFIGHKNFVTSCAFAPDGKSVISASSDNSLKLWNRDGKCLKTFIGHKYPVTSCAVAPDGKSVISASYDGSLKLWDMDGKCLKTFIGHVRPVTSCAFAPDGKTVISASYDGSLKLWNRDGKCLKTFNGHHHWVISCAFAPDGNSVISASYDGSLKFWNMDGKCLKTFNGHHSIVTSCAFAPDGKTVISASYDSSLKLWNRDGKCLKTFIGHDSRVTSCAVAPDGKSVISASYDNSIKLWNRDGKCLKTFIGHKYPVTSCAFAPDGKTVISASYDSSLKLWDMDGKCLKTFIGHVRPVTSCAFAPDGKTVISASDDHSLKLWDRNGKCLKTFIGHKNTVTSCAVAPDGKSVISASDDHSLKLWDRNGKCLKTFIGHDSRVTSCAVAPDGKSVISASYDNSIKLWNRDGKCLKTFIGHKYPVTSCAFAPDGKTVISASYDNSIKLWNRNGNIFRTIYDLGNGNRSVIDHQKNDFSRYAGNAWRWMFYQSGDELIPFDDVKNYQDYLVEDIPRSR